MKLWKKGQTVEYPFARGRIEYGMIIKVDDQRGAFSDDPWIRIQIRGITITAHQTILVKDGCRVVLREEEIRND